MSTALGNPIMLLSIGHEVIAIILSRIKTGRELIIWEGILSVQ